MDVRNESKVALAQVAQWIIAERTVSSENNELDEVSHDVGNHVPGCEVAGQILVSRAPGIRPRSILLLSMYPIV